jgi:DNA repair protein RadA/Sms
VVIIDSIQTIAHPAVEGQPGGVAQVREVAAALIRTAKQRGIPMILVGHVTKDGSIAGPRLLEHLVDVVLNIEGERHARLRLIRAMKNRYGAADEVGCFELADSGIIEVTDPSALFISARPEPVPGTCVTVTLEGSRPLLAEVQALVVPSSAGTPRRSTSGLDSARVAMVHAVLQRRVGLGDLDRAETFVATVGGVKVGEPAADLAVAIALAGGLLDRPLATRTIAVGEVGLAGEVRRVSAISRRLAEAARIGFTHAVVPRDPGPIPAGLKVLEVDDVRQVIDVLARERST